MIHLKKSVIAMVLLTAISGSRTWAQDYFSSFTLLEKLELVREQEILQGNEYKSTGLEQGSFYKHPLLIDGKPLDYNTFNLTLEGNLTVVKGAPITGIPVQVPFYVYIRRNGNNIFIPGKETPDLKQFEVDVHEIMKYAEPGDELVIEAVKREDGLVKRILKLPKGGC